MQTKYLIFRETTIDKQIGWMLARANIDDLNQANREFNRMKDENPNKRLRLLQVTETPIREE